MGIVQVQLPDHLKQIIDQQVAEGRVESESAYIEEAVRRYAEDIQAEDEIVAEAEAGIADAEAGCFITVSSSGDAEALHVRTMARLRDRLVSDQG
jgi:putative addiction module CopG family antidote